jgi:hypothetical protein
LLRESKSITERELMEIFRLKETSEMADYPVWSASKSRIQTTKSGVYVATGSFRALRFDTHGEEVSVLDGDLFVFSHKEVSRDLFIMFRSRISESLPRHPHGILLGFDRISDRIMLNFDRASVVSCGTAGLSEVKSES